MLKTGLLGSAFNPPTMAHLALAEAAMKELGLDQICFMPTRTPPHKVIEGHWNDKTRSLLIKLASAAISTDQLNSQFNPPAHLSDQWPIFLEYYHTWYQSRHRDSWFVSDYELQQTQISYSIDTVKALLSQNPARQITLIIGMDQAAVFDTWKNWQELKTLAEIAVAVRGDYNPESIRQKFPFLKFFPFEKLDISSTEVRKRLKNKEEIKGLVPEVLENFISFLE